MKKLHILILLALSAIFVNAQGFLDDKDLAAYYPFDGNTFDVSGNNHHGTGFGITYDKGKIGQCVSFDSNYGSNACFIDIENSIVSPNNTVSFWFMIDRGRIRFKNKNIRSDFAIERQNWCYIFNADASYIITEIPTI